VPWRRRVAGREHGRGKSFAPTAIEEEGLRSLAAMGDARGMRGIGSCVEDARSWKHVDSVALGACFKRIRLLGLAHLSDVDD
jgi:hypothetical protein